MDLPSLTQIESFWPDVAAPFAEVVPGGCRLARTEDEWRAGTDAFRRRRIELSPEPDAPELAELLEEASEDAFRHGWTPLDDGRFELEDVILTLEADRYLVVEFLQPWPPDHGAPVETSEMFQNLVRRLLRLGGEPARLEKRVIVNPLAIMTAEVLEETVEMPSDEALGGALATFGFEAQDATCWRSVETTETHRITASVWKTDGWVKVQMRKARLAS